MYTVTIYKQEQRNIPGKNLVATEREVYHTNNITQRLTVGLVAHLLVSPPFRFWLIYFVWLPTMYFGVVSAHCLFARLSVLAWEMNIGLRKKTVQFPSR
jgi:hypothetical protein